MKYSWAVTAGNQYLANRAVVGGAKNIVIIPTVIDLERYEAKEDYNSGKFIIGWIGSPSTYKYLLEIKEELAGFALQFDAEVIVIGAFTEEKTEMPFRYIPWKATTETQAIRSFDVGIMPLDDTPWSRGKCSFKLIQYMACGVPVIASPVGMNKEVVSNSNGFLVNDSKAWGDLLSQYYYDLDLRELHGREGRMAVEKTYSLQVTTAVWLQLLNLYDAC